MGKLIDITGQKFGRLTVLKRGKTYRGMVFWICQCDCGNIVEASSGHLRYGHTTSCGCYAQEVKKHPNKYDLSGEYGICYFNTGGCFIFDKEDYDLVKDYTWLCSSAGYVMNHKYNGPSISFTRLITNCPVNMVVDHINHNTLDNRKCNLRICTPQQNMFNKKARGISNRNGKYEAFITVNYQYIYLGIYNTEEEALKARKEAEVKYFGEFVYREEMEVLNYG